MLRVPLFVFLCTTLSAQTPLFDLTRLTTAAPPQSLVAGDFNADGKPDLAVTEGNSLEILLGNGDGTFRSARIISLTAPATHIAKADFNQDGKLDLAVSVGANGNVVVLLGNGDGSFQAAVDVGAQSPNGQTTNAGVPGLAVGDVNGDGKPDLVLGPYELAASSTVVVMLGNGDGSFRRGVTTTMNRLASARAVVTDFNGDGRADVFVTYYTGVVVAGKMEFGLLLSGNADGSLTLSPPLSRDWNQYVDGYAVTAQDVNGNAKPDIVVMQEWLNTDGTQAFQVLAYLDGSLTPISSLVTISTDAHGPLESLAAADTNGDGKTDLLVTDSLGNLFILYGAGDGTFKDGAPPPEMYTGAIQSYTLGSSTGNSDLIGALAAADFRGTGRADVVLVVTGKNVAFLKNGSGASPVVSSAGVVNTATLTAIPAVPGSLMTIFGSGLTYDSGSAGRYGVLDMLFGLTVELNGVRAPLFYASPGQANLQVPWELAGQTRATLVARRNGAASAPVTVSLAPYAPGLFTATAQGNGQAAAIIVGTNGSIPAPAGAFPVSRPIHPGEYLALWGTGLGPLDMTAGQPALVTGQPTPGPHIYDHPNGPLYPTTSTPYVTVGGVSAKVQFSGLAPYMIGLYQINIQIPDGAPLGNAVPVILYIGGVPSNTVTIAIQ
jgi:uncharacterized protein (TIGR03437 family)